MEERGGGKGRERERKRETDMKSSWSISYHNDVSKTEHDYTNTVQNTKRLVTKNVCVYILTDCKQGQEVKDKVQQSIKTINFKSSIIDTVFTCTAHTHKHE